ncbi:MAG TPA: tail fiber protein [Chitinophagales bacterium]|nr:tail fiber protein [Chitinophagales bacterium]
MKKPLLILLSMYFSLITFAQVNQLGINYQAQIRNSIGVLIADSSVTLQFSLLPGQLATTPTWKEQWTVQTDQYGMVHLVIGQGTKISATVATFDLVDFTSAAYYLKTELKVGGSFSTLSNEPFQSVPYAKVAGNATLFPPGFIMPFAGDSSKIPNGWFLCDGREISRSQYSALYAVILDNWGRGNNSTTFNLPDLRGTFLRGRDGSAGNDPDNTASTNNGTDGKRYAKYTGGNIGNNVGSYQNDAFQGHWHHLKSPGDSYNAQGNTAIFTTPRGAIWQYEGDYCQTPVSDGTNGAPRISSESRPKNASVNFLIKY